MRNDVKYALEEESESEARLERLLEQVDRAVTAEVPRQFVPVRQAFGESAAPTPSRILISAQHCTGQFTTGCDFQVSVNGGAFTPLTCIEPGRALLDVPSQPRPLALSIRVAPASSSYWPVEGRFELRANGSLIAVSAPPEFRTPQPVLLPGSGPVISIIAVVPRLRDVTSQVLQSLRQVPGSVPGQRCRNRMGMQPAFWPPNSFNPWPPVAPITWDTPLLEDHHYIASPPVLGRDLNVALHSLDPDTDDLVFEVAGMTAPKLIAVSWPRALTRTADANPTPFLINFRPTVGQNVREGFYVGPCLGTYPFGWDYLFFGLWRVVNFQADPLTQDPFAKGLPYQITASGKNVVLVCPLNKVGPELGSFMKAAVIEEILQEIQSFMFRRAGVFNTPSLGRTAIGAFSSGNTVLAQFLNNPQNRAHPFYLNTLRELYMFEPPGGSVPGYIAQATRWASRGSNADKMIRIYTRDNHSIYRSLLGVTPPSSAPFVADSASGLRTAAVLPIAAWKRLTTAHGASTLVRDWQEPHQLISALMLTDALRRSGF